MLAAAAAPEIPDGAAVSDPDDIDALLAAAAPAPAAPVAEKDIPDGTDVSDPDDIDALLAAAGAPEPAAMLDLPDGSDVSDPDDIDALLAAAAAPVAPVVEKEIPDGAEVSDPDDIDALLSAAEQQMKSLIPEVPDGADVTDPDDIDALLAATEASQDEATAEQVAAQLSDDAELTDPDDIDALLASTAAPVTSQAQTELPDDADVSDPDDIDALLAAAAGPEQTSTSEQSTSEQSTSELPQDTDISDADDIDALVSESQTTQDDADGEDGAAIPPEQEIDKQAKINKGKIDNFTEEYVAPFLGTDFSFLSAAADEVVVDDEISDELDIDELLSNMSEQSDASDDALDIGDDFSMESPQALVETGQDLPEVGAGFAPDDNEHVELSPDFTEDNVLADLLGDEFLEQEDVYPPEPIADEVVDIDDLDNLDFEDMLASIEQDTAASSTIEPADKETENNLGGDLGDDLGDELGDDIGDDIGDIFGEDFGEVLGDDLGTDTDDANEVMSEDDFVSIDALLSDSLAEEPAQELYNKDKMDVGLDEFPEFASDSELDDEADDNGFTTKLDLAKVYIEMGDVENAQEILQDVVKLGNEQQQSTAKELMGQLK